MANFICSNIYFLCLAILCIRGEDSLSFEISLLYSTKNEIFFFKQLLQNKLPLPGGEALDSIFSGSFPFYEKIKHGFDFPGINSLFQQGEDPDFTKIGSVFGENNPFQKTDKSEKALDFPKVDSPFSESLLTQTNFQPDEGVKSAVQKAEDGTYNYVYFVQVKPNAFARSIIVANIRCNSGYRKDKMGKCRKML
uniref:Navipin-3a n=1 Tax=Nasonia vitripennis TaxID=7425 RepID=V9M4U7_NASVI|nr:navipin-3a precursor [Nasonia vitripennis]